MLHDLKFVTRGKHATCGYDVCMKRRANAHEAEKTSRVRGIRERALLECVQRLVARYADRNVGFDIRGETITVEEEELQSSTC